MATKLRTVAALLVLAAVCTWVATGANRGWTKTSVFEEQIDPVTGLTGHVEKPNQFIPGVDFLAATTVAAGVLVGISFLFRRKPKQNDKPKELQTT